MNGELDGLRVHGECAVGWDPMTPPNEVVDEYGHPAQRSGFGEPDPRAPSRRVYDAPDVRALRERLRTNNGIRGLEICSPAEVARAARIYRRDGFVVVRDLLDVEQLARIREGCAAVLAEMLAQPGPGGRKYVAESGRLPHRYCYGTTSASRQMLHHPAWTQMIDLPTATPILTEIFGTDDYLVWGAGGDLCLPGAIEYQHLHTDGIDMQSRDDGDRRLAFARRQGLDIEPGKSFSALEFRSQRLVMDRTPSGVTINFTMTNLTWENGPIRQIPGTHAATQPPPVPEHEPEWMRLSTLVGVPAGAGILRDTRAWHGATPNLSREVRALPSVEFAAGWRDGQGFQRTMPHDIWESLSAHGRRICRFVKQAPGVWPYGAGDTQPLASKRREGYRRSAGTNGTVNTVYTDPRSAGTAVRLHNQDDVDGDQNAY